MTYRLVITDLDNTLYDWVTYFAKSFSIMVNKLNELTDIPVDILLDEFKTVHRKYQDSEHPFAVLELPSIRARYPGLSPAELRREIDPSLQAFNSSLRRTLHLYPGVSETLKMLHSSTGMRIIAHTEATAPNALFRLQNLGIISFFDHLYALESLTPSHPFPDEIKQLNPRPGFVRIISRNQKKPNPKVLLEICNSEGVAPNQTIYIGDSFIKDISMAKEAGVKAVWARYGTLFDRQNLDILVRITHWTDEDVAREASLRKTYSNVSPDVICDSFTQLAQIARSEDDVDKIIKYS